MVPPVPSQNRRFVVQQHKTVSGVHWDVMIEADDVLWTWRMPCSPEHVGDVPLSLTKIADHPLRFLTYEGPVQNKTGSVHIADSGRVEITPHTHQSLTINFDGKHLQGQFELTCTETAQKKWKLSKKFA
jgi:hypothetical protein